MGRIYHGIDELIGHTPLVELRRLAEAEQAGGVILGKMEYFNAAGSSKDRVGKSMIDEAQRAGILKPGAVIIEPTSGNTGVGLAAVAASRGYQTIIVMPDSMSIERRNLLTAHGAKLILTDGKLGMSGAIKKAQELKTLIPDSWIAGQFVNPANPDIHEKTTGPEIWEDTDGTVDIFVAGIGTGGTITGIGRYLKKKKPDIKIVGVEPASSPVLTEGKSGAHGIQGIGAGFIPQVLDTKIYNQILTVKDEDAFDMGRKMAQKEGLLVGISSGAALWGAIQLSKRPENKGKIIVAFLPDTGERYLSTPMFQEINDREVQDDRN